jgi:hypothetical protein
LVTRGEREAFGVRPVHRRFGRATSQQLEKLFMDEKPKSIWKKSWTGWRGILLWFILFFVVFMIGLSLPIANLPNAGVFAGMLALITVLLISFVHWLFCRRNLKRSLFALACFATLIALLYAEEDWRGWHAWQKFKHEWEAKGEHFDFASAVPPPVPDSQNFALTPVIASSYETYFDKSGHEVRPRNTNVVDRLSMMTWRDNPWAEAQVPKSDNPGWLASKKTDLKIWQDYFRSKPPTNSIETNSFSIAPQPQSPADDVLLALSKYDVAIEEIREASKLPYSRFPLTYGNGEPADILLPHLAALKYCAQVLDLRALAELQNGQDEKALADVKLSLYLADSIRTEPFLISQLVRNGILQMTLQPVWEGLAAHKWSDAQLMELDQALAKFNFLADFKLSMRSQIGFQSAMIEYLRRQPEQLINFSTDKYRNQDLPFLARIAWQLIPSGWFYQNQLKIARRMAESYLPVADENRGIISKTLARRADAALGADTRHGTPYNLLERELFPEFGPASKKFAYAQNSVDLARVAIALERYRLAHGEFPESLDALAPQFLEKIPHDVINGQPLHYHRTDDGQFILYSVGWNEKDDGGVVGLTKNGGVINDQGDWVWRYPKAE